MGKELRGGRVRKNMERVKPQLENKKWGWIKFTIRYGEALRGNSSPWRSRKDIRLPSGKGAGAGGLLKVEKLEKGELKFPSLGTKLGGGRSRTGTRI